MVQFCWMRFLPCHCLIIYSSFIQTLGDFVSFSEIRKSMVDIIRN